MADLKMGPSEMVAFLNATQERLAANIKRELEAVKKDLLQVLEAQKEFDPSLLRDAEFMFTKDIQVDEEYAKEGIKILACMDSFSNRDKSIGLTGPIGKGAGTYRVFAFLVRRP